MTYNFDMDGTIADLYAVDNWRERLRAEDASPYIEARPLVNMSKLAKRLHKMQRRGDKIRVISWSAMNSSLDYMEQVANAKREWLEKHLPSVEWDEVVVVAYGTPKTECGNGVLFDDNEEIRAEWGENAFEPSEIFQIMI